MNNRTQTISLAAIGLASALQIATLFMPWMGFTAGGDISQSSIGTDSFGAVGRPFADQTAFQLSSVLTVVVALVALVAIVTALAKSVGIDLVPERTAGQIFIGAGVVGLVAAAIIVFGIESDPFGDIAGGPTGSALLNWGALSGAKLGAFSAAVIVLAGCAFLWANREPAASPQRAPASAA